MLSVWSGDKERLIVSPPLGLGKSSIFATKSLKKRILGNCCHPPGFFRRDEHGVAKRESKKEEDSYFCANATSISLISIRRPPNQRTRSVNKEAEEEEGEREVCCFFACEGRRRGEGEFDNNRRLSSNRRGFAKLSII